MAECSRREISSGMARNKLIQWLSKDSPLTEKLENEIKQTVETLVKDKYIDDSRFARAYTRDKLRFSKWGPDKILNGLSDAGVDKSIAEEAVKAEEDLALQVLSDLLSKKKADLQKKQEKKNAGAQSQIEAVSDQLKDAEFGKERASLQRKLYALRMKAGSSDIQIHQALVSYARGRGFTSAQIRDALKVCGTL